MDEERWSHPEDAFIFSTGAGGLGQVPDMYNTESVFRLNGVICCKYRCRYCQTPFYAEKRDKYFCINCGKENL